MSHGTFATAINCMDGRTQLPVNDWIKKEYGVDYVDTITEPGPNKILADNADQILLDSIKKRVNISVNKHHSKLIAVVGHHDCAGNPVDKSIQLGHIKLALETVKAWNFGVEIIGLWVGDNWQVEKVS